ncbi:MAG: hypothetical protein ABSE79_17925 [Terriglobia bacterium]
MYTKHVHSGTGAVTASFLQAAVLRAHSARKLTSGLRGCNTPVLKSSPYVNSLTIGGNMSIEAAEHHTKAAEHHEHAAEHHRKAAEHYKGGNHQAAAHHAHLAHGHSHHAAHHAAEAAKLHVEHHGHK